MAEKNVLTQKEIKAQLEEVNEWELKDSTKLSREFSFKNFKEALAFTNEVGEVAEDKMHHPDIYLTWGVVKIDITTHEADGLTSDDFDLAKSIDEKV